MISRGSPLSSDDEEHALSAREPGRRLVEHQQARFAGQRHAQLQLALLAMREGSHGRLEDVRQVDETGDLLGSETSGIVRGRAARVEAPALHAPDREEQALGNRQAP